MISPFLFHADIVNVACIHDRRFPFARAAVSRKLKKCKVDLHDDLKSGYVKLT